MPKEEGRQQSCMGAATILWGDHVRLDPTSAARHQTAATMTIICDINNGKGKGKGKGKGSSNN